MYKTFTLILLSSFALSIDFNTIKALMSKSQGSNNSGGGLSSQLQSISQLAKLSGNSNNLGKLMGGGNNGMQQMMNQLKSQVNSNMNNQGGSGNNNMQQMMNMIKKNMNSQNNNQKQGMNRINPQQGQQMNRNMMSRQNNQQVNRGNNQQRNRGNNQQMNRGNQQMNRGNNQQMNRGNNQQMNRGNNQRKNGGMDKQMMKEIEGLSKDNFQRYQAYKNTQNMAQQYHMDQMQSQMMDKNGIPQEPENPLFFLPLSDDEIKNYMSLREKKLQNNKHSQN